ncbi:ribosome biogenesis GTPase Der [Bacteroidales bacterium OttesenSCG-928-B11]|nr:ribosome biogenesis GTPase Der [Bacteroidales bacterium OttesenSCG-928-E04]MDL2309110.1 ribosome biogenesis GTPase Der [Bacteroidales bacterium OttesenSCG-928-C03]MDL2312943.1 ribosome biogenesis GTPase Der [Bacteroidales bacterium OttesenSCG-928-B11]MDL2326673.1 ribosome biogenesis GTPase Der [Bacteroidales bacterium OttesenSCG-928-A14]
MSNILSLVGRPNVGKSTLFNRLTQTREAIVDSISGVTRDRNYGKSDWNGYEFSVIDTGGYVVGSDDIFESEIRKQAALAVDESDVIILMVDGREGLTPLDREVADMLRRSKKPFYLAVNKIDSPSNFFDYAEFYELGISDIYPISAVSGSGTGDLLDEVVKHFNIEDDDENLDDLPKLTIVGKPNVGKSSIINTFLGYERHIVTPIAGTTRDSAYTRYKGFGFDFYLIDTAGLRKKKKVEENLEFYSVMRTVRAIEKSDVCVVMCDATEGFEAQDLSIFSLAARNRKAVVLVVNKWDLVEKDHKTHKEFEDLIRKKIAPFTDVPIIFTSVTNKQRIYKVLESAIHAYENKSRKIPTSELNEVLLPIIKQTPPPMVKDKMVKIKYITQLPTPFPAFAFFCNLPQYVRENYKRFLENKIREQWDFKGVPMEIYFRKK